MNPIAVTLLTGFLGAGKTTLLRHILNEQHGYKIAVIENEFGEVSVDDQLIGDRATQIKTLTNGCICCSRSNELEDALLDLLDNLDKGNIQFDRLVIECTGMADPGPIIQTFFSHEILCQRYLLDGVIALVDAVHADEQMNQFTIAQSQVGYADRILLTKTDVAGEAEKLRERLARINARAPVYTVTHGDIDLGLLFNTNGFMLEENVVSTKPRFHFIADTPTTLLEMLQDKYPGQYPNSFRRTMQRRGREWKLQSGAEQEVMFRQWHQPGLRGLLDFTKLKGVVVTIAGKLLVHMLYNFRLEWSHWS